MSFWCTKAYKNGINSINILHTGLRKSLYVTAIYYGQCGENFKSAFYVCIELNKMKLMWVIHMYQNIIVNFHFSCTESCKRLWPHYVLCLEMTGREFLVKFWFTFLTLLTISNKVVRFVYLFVRLESSNSRKCSSNVLQFIYIIHVWYRMDRIENP